MGNKKYNRGAKLENDTANTLEDNGWAVVRAAGSGTAGRNACDVLAVNSSAILILECKTYKEHGNNIVTQGDYEQMMEMAERTRNDEPMQPSHRDVVTALVLRQKGKLGKRYVAPFPRVYRPDGDEELFKYLHEEYDNGSD